MRAVIQRVTRASVRVDGAVVGQIGAGLCVLVGVEPTDGADEVSWMARRVSSLRIFADDAGKMNRSVADIGGAILLVSQFTLLADTSRGHRPSFIGAAPPEQANALYESLAARLRSEHGLSVEMGRFGAHMTVDIHNDGPVTIVLDSNRP